MGVNGHMKALILKSISYFLLPRMGAHSNGACRPINHPLACSILPLHFCSALLHPTFFGWIVWLRLIIIEFLVHRRNCHGCLCSLAGLAVFGQDAAVSASRHYVRSCRV